MATTDVSTALFYQPWKQQGMDFLLQAEPVPAALSLCHTKALQPGRATQVQRPAPHTPQAPRAQMTHTAQSTHTVQATAQQQGAPTHGQKNQAQWQSKHYATQSTHQSPPPAPLSVPSTAQGQTKPDMSTQGQARLSLPREQWPQDWQARFHATKPARVIWTYWNLGHDLCGEASDARRHLLRKILAELKHPAGTHSFWPMALPQENSAELVPNIPVFWSGVRLLDARVLIILGDAAAKALGYNVYDMPFKEFRKQDKLVILAKDMEVLMEKPHMYSMLMDYLRPHLTQYLQLM